MGRVQKRYGKFSKKTKTLVIYISKIRQFCIMKGPANFTLLLRNYLGFLKFGPPKIGGVLIPKYHHVFIFFQYTTVVFFNFLCH